MAIDYTQIICQQQGNGPYYLLGFSFGGFIAMAIANLLERQGQNVAFVGLVESDVNLTDPSYPKNIVLQNLIMQTYSLIRRELGILQPLSAEIFADEARELSEKILSSAGEQQRQAIINWLTERKYLRENIPHSVLTEYLSRSQAHMGLIENFQPEMIHAPMFMWSAQESLLGPKRSDKNWGMYTSGIVVEETIAGDHFAVMYPPSVHILAEQLDKSLRAIQAS
jgi:thioesterase domain-containing protein